MSDPKYGEPVDETTPDAAPPAVDDVVGSANAGLAEAEAAAGEREFSFSDRGSDLSLDYERYAESTASESSAPEPSTPASAAPESSAPAAAIVPPAAASAAVSSEPLYRADLDDRTRTRDTASDEPVVRDEDRVATTRVDTTPPAGGTVAAPAMQPIFVQAPEAPRPRGNRGAVAAIGLLAALVFAVVLLVASLAFLVVADGMPDGAQLGEEALAILMTAEFWVPVAVFYLAFCILGAFINRGRWGLWVIFGLLVGLASYGGHLLGALVAAPFWTLTASQGAQLAADELFAPLALVALVAGREITIWFGAWVASRGRRVTELNAEAQREYERTLEAGPQLHRA